MSRTSVGKKPPKKPSPSTKLRDLQRVKIAFFYDRINKWGGAERLLQNLLSIWPNVPVYTLVSNTDRATWAKPYTVISTPLSLPWLRDQHELLAPISPLGFESFDFKEFDIVISVTSADAKAIITPPQTLHLCYCLTPPRYLFAQEKTYLNNPGFGQLNPLARKVFRTLSNYLKNRDLVLANRPDVYVAISETVAERIRRFYNQEAEVVYPGVDTRYFRLAQKPQKADYYLVVSRLVPYKKVDLVIKAFNRLGYPLVIVGSGRQGASLRAIAKDNIHFAGQVSDSKLRSYYQRAQALIFPAEEDFGLIPLEAAACGTPVIAYNAGGARETVVDKQTGIFFTKQTASAIIRAVKRFERRTFRPLLCRHQAVKFNQNRSLGNFVFTIYRQWLKHQKIYS